jgi:hypothetical protein
MGFIRRFRQSSSGFHFFGFRNNNFFYRARSAALRPTPVLEVQVSLCPPATGWPRYTPRHRLLFSSPSTTSKTASVVKVPRYRSRRPGSDSRRYQIFWEVMGLERGPLSLVRITEERLRSRKPKLTAVEIRCVDHATPSIR